MVSCLDYSINSGLVVSGHPDRLVRLWDPRTHKGMQEFVFCLTYLAMVTTKAQHHKMWISGVAWHPVSPYIFATSSLDRLVCVWDTRGSTPLHSVKGHTDKVLCVKWADDGSHIFSGGADCKLRRFRFPSTVTASV